MGELTPEEAAAQPTMCAPTNPGLFSPTLPQLSSTAPATPATPEPAFDGIVPVDPSTGIEENGE